MLGSRRSAKAVTATDPEGPGTNDDDDDAAGTDPGVASVDAAGGQAAREASSCFFFSFSTSVVRFMRRIAAA